MRAERLTYLLLAGLALLGLGFGNPGVTLVEEGNRLFQEGNFEAALVKYDQALLELPEAEEIRYNIGGVRHLQGDLETAAALYRAILDSPDPALAARAAYNLGNTFFRQDDYPRAAGAYKTALKLDPGDEDARYNYELARLKIQEQQQEEQQQKQKEQQQEQEQQEEEEQEQQPAQPTPPEEQEEDTGEEESEPPPEEGPEEEQPSPDRPEEGELDPEDVERLLDAMLSEEEDFRAEIREKKQEEMEEVWKDW